MVREQGQRSRPPDLQVLPGAPASVAERGHCPVHVARVRRRRGSRCRRSRSSALAKILWLSTCLPGRPVWAVIAERGAILMSCSRTCATSWWKSSSGPPTAWSSRPDRAHASASCPGCGAITTGVHGRYRRSLRDATLGGTPVVIRLWVRRFVCTTADCHRRTFTEQIPGLTTPYARYSPPLRAALTAIAVSRRRCSRKGATRPRSTRVSSRPSTSSWRRCRASVRSVLARRFDSRASAVCAGSARCRRIGPFQLLHDEPPPGAALHRGLHLVHTGVAGQELPQRRPPPASTPVQRWATG